jgi:hypothetical protein
MLCYSTSYEKIDRVTIDREGGLRFERRVPLLSRLPLGVRYTTVAYHPPSDRWQRFEFSRASRTCMVHFTRPLPATRGG